jgi:preprotein translocase subunit SecA
MLKQFFNQKNIKKYQSLVKEINHEYDKYSKDETLHIPNKLVEIKESKWNSKQKIIHAMAIAKIASTKVLSMTYYDVQIMGALALVDGNMAEMKTGEGKTLTCSLAVAANYVLGFSTHVATANEYLARRDAETLFNLYSAMGISCSFNIAGLPHEQKKRSYSCNVIYSTAQELGFDFLRDNLLYDVEKRVQPLNFKLTKCIIDEADFVLIDEARTPLIISGESPVQDANTYHLIKQVILGFDKIEGEADISPFAERNEDGDFWVDEKQRNVYLSEKGYAKLEKATQENNLLKNTHHQTHLYDMQNSWLLNEALNALRAQYLYQKDKDYIVRDDEIIIIDQNTGRLSEGRTWSNGLHQAIETKENVKINPENMTLGSISIQNYFRIYHQISGMSGTIMQSSEEFEEIYNCKTISIPTNKKVVRIDNQDRIYLNTEVKYNKILEEIKARHAKAQPILIGTVSVAESEIISNLLNLSQIPHNVLNAKNNALEAQIIAQAGKPYAVTVATSMAGRGTDIILGGNKESILDILHTQAQFVQERQNFIANLLQEQEQQIEFQIQIAPFNNDIETFSNQLEMENLVSSEQLVELMNQDLHSLISRLVNLQFRINKQIELINNEWQNWKKLVIEQGGLFVIGSSRNESRRIDDQLKGRAGRQGDPGESLFFMCLEDSWVNIFGKNPIFSQLIKTLPKDESISSPSIVKIFSKAQRNIESHHFEIRKNLFQYDSIANEGREKFLELRNELLLNNQSIKSILAEKLEYDLNIITNDDFLNFVEEHKNLNQTPKVEDILDLHFTEIYELIDDYTQTEFYNYYNPKRNYAHDSIQDKIKQSIYEKEEMILNELRFNLLAELDKNWTHHLAFIDDAQKNVGLTSMAQKNPIHEYKKICLASFSNMLDEFRSKLVLDFFDLDLNQEIIEGTNDEVILYDNVNIEERKTQLI